ncbi:hypothetical protein PMI22_04305 [Pseudomonas sp. GM21]|nr:hypothetical protein PMI22_04305 [Pseudomonas sp. GM21]
MLRCLQPRSLMTGRFLWVLTTGRYLADYRPLGGLMPLVLLCGVPQFAIHENVARTERVIRQQGVGLAAASARIAHQVRTDRVTDAPGIL